MNLWEVVVLIAIVVGIPAGLLLITSVLDAMINPHVDEWDW